jgi:hypothetical protein
MLIPKIVSAMTVAIAVSLWVCLIHMPPETYEARANVKQVMCGRYCYPTVGFVSESHGAEDRSYSLSAYENIEVGSIYTLQHSNPWSALVFILATLCSAAVPVVFVAMRQTQAEFRAL